MTAREKRNRIEKAKRTIAIEAILFHLNREYVKSENKMKDSIQVNTKIVTCAQCGGEQLEHTSATSFACLKCVGENRHCEECKKTTIQVPTLYNPDEPEAGEIWQCTQCLNHTSFV